MSAAVIPPEEYELRDIFAAEDLDDLKEVMQLPAGQRVLMRILAAAGLWRPSMTPSSWIYWNEGRKSLGLELMREMLLADPDTYRRAETAHLVQSWSRDQITTYPHEEEEGDV